MKKKLFIGFVALAALAAVSSMIFINSISANNSLKILSGPVEALTECEAIAYCEDPEGVIDGSLWVACVGYECISTVTDSGVPEVICDGNVSICDYWWI